MTWAVSWAAYACEDTVQPVEDMLLHGHRGRLHSQSGAWSCNGLVQASGGVGCFIAPVSRSYRLSWKVTGFNCVDVAICIGSMSAWSSAREVEV